MFAIGIFFLIYIYYVGFSESLKLLYSNNDWIGASVNGGGQKKRTRFFSFKNKSQQANKKKSPSEAQEPQTKCFYNFFVWINSATMATIENFDHQQSTAKRSFDRCSPRGDDDSAIQPSGAI